jgi:DNA-directed RNA polymerase subunit M/transcription elongation factor TFIIS
MSTTPEKSAHDYAYGDQDAEGMGGRMTDIASSRSPTRPKVVLSATVTCPGCGGANKPEWMNKLRHGDGYATTMFCENCGSLIAIWALHVDAQIVANKQAKG